MAVKAAAIVVTSDEAFPEQGMYVCVVQQCMIPSFVNECITAIYT